MKATDYQSAVARTMDTSLDQKQATCSYAMGLAGESGEVVEPLKKWCWHNRSLDVGDLQKELGDVMFYVAALCNTWGIDLGACMEGNIKKLQERYPAGYAGGRKA